MATMAVEKREKRAAAAKENNVNVNHPVSLTLEGKKQNVEKTSYGSPSGKKKLLGPFCVYTFLFNLKKYD